MKKLLIIFVLIALSLGSERGKVLTRDGREVPLESITFKQDTIFSADQMLTRDDVKRVVLREETHAKSDFADVFAPKDSLIGLARQMEKKYPDAQGYILIDRGVNTLRADGSIYSINHYVGKIAGPGTMYFGQRSLWFEEGRSRVRFIAARTILPDGSIIEFDPDDAEVQRSSGSMVDFDNDVYLSATFPGVREGAIVECIYEDEEYNPHDPNMFFPSWYFGDDIPVAQSSVTVILPDTKQLYYRLTSFPNVESSRPVIEKTDTSISYTWALYDIPPMLEEPQMPAYGDVVPRFEGCLFADYEYIYDWLGGLQKTRLELTPDIKKTAAKIVKNSKSREDSLAQIYYYVQRDIEYVSIKGSVSSGQTGHSAQFTLDNKYGDCTDKSVLMSALYRALGFEARPIIIMTNDDETGVRTLPNHSGNHAIVLLEVDGKRLFLDGTYTAMRFPYFGDWDMDVAYLDALGRNIGRTIITPPDENSIHTEYKIELNADGSAIFHRQNSLNGPYEATYREWWEYYGEPMWENLSAEWMASSVPGAVLDSFNIEGVGNLNVPLSEEFYFHADDWAEVTGDILLFDIPGLASALTFDEVQLPVREHAIEYEAPYSESHLVKIVLPDGYTVEPITVEETDQPYFSYTASLEMNGNTLTFRDNFTLKERVVPAESYTEYREALRRISSFAARGVAARKVSGK